MGLNHCTGTRTFYPIPMTLPGCKEAVKPSKGNCNAIATR